MLINAVFEGGGVKGISLVGAVKAAEQEGVTYHRLAGTSSGSIVAALISAGYSADEMKDVIERTPLISLLRRSKWFDTPWIGPVARILLKKGLYSGEALEYWVKGLLRAKGIRTFGDLPPGRLQIIASDITNGKILILPQDLVRFGMEPDKFEVAKAVRMSSSIPYFYDPVMLRLPPNQRRGVSFADQFVYVVDGALLSNFPLWLFDRDQLDSTGRLIPTVGFQLVGKQSGQRARIRGPVSMLQAMVDTMLSAHDERYIEQTNRYRTIKIPGLGIRTTQFDISSADQQRLFESGLRAGSEFFGKWSTKVYYDHFTKHSPIFQDDKIKPLVKI
ncbi:patatin-like phospholipase family protein [Paenibacillus sp. JX-17]|uniref:Patatin-like phospholipase family protein n=1 Tax=Paenibacillus lacisoli TaxID=3064525 RepID=A0ABT9C9C2_9BACL|nr:patatin-like phospholipase family protein [Paenibacillus sp. JX-17]MDO7905183.1 patatin-like phospholipase family protein [Paenibacillus sp. JX-17]